MDERKVGTYALEMALLDDDDRWRLRVEKANVKSTLLMLAQLVMPVGLVGIRSLGRGIYSKPRLIHHACVLKKSKK